MTESDRKWQKVTESDRKWQKVTESDRKWQKVTENVRNVTDACTMEVSSLKMP